MDNGGLKIIVESKVPYLRGLLEPHATVEYLDPDNITPHAVADADAMIVRTRTRCDARLLEGSRCSFVATATIGTDHIDLPWCVSRGITVANAPGCNAPAVAQYVLGSVAALATRPMHELCIGIVGVGHVGRIVERWARSLGMRVMLCDPPRSRAEGGTQWSSLDEIASEAHVISFHTPLTTDGTDATLHMAGEHFFSKLRQHPIVINAARGPVVDTPALIAAIDRGLTGAAVIDCWEGEPLISRELLERATVATPHIAGYSRQGKWRASQMSLDALTTHFGLPPVALAETAPAPVPDAVTAAAVAASYNPLEADTPALKACPENFEWLRNNYHLRDELH
ncbi:MAG: 4-phosphoerythronate dehydrogenase [Muribaculaceae bacterium]|nr:4-phosphoerythronate dehydrogenase [Muribaculaceae bacterium]